MAKLAPTKRESLLLALVLTAAWHVIPFWAFLFFPPARGLYESLGQQGYWALRDTVGGMWVLLARQITGTIIPRALTHMAVNFIACL